MPLIYSCDGRFIIYKHEFIMLVCQSIDYIKFNILLHSLFIELYSKGFARYGYYIIIYITDSP